MPVYGKVLTDRHFCLRGATIIIRLERSVPGPVLVNALMKAGQYEDAVLRYRTEVKNQYGYDVTTAERVTLTTTVTIYKQICRKTSSWFGRAREFWMHDQTFHIESQEIRVAAKTIGGPVPCYDQIDIIPMRLRHESRWGDDGYDSNEAALKHASCRRKFEEWLKLFQQALLEAEQQQE